MNAFKRSRRGAADPSSSSGSSSASQVASNAAPLDRTPFPLPLPANHALNPRTLFFGYNVSDEWMSKYLYSRLGTFISNSEVEERHLVEATLLCLVRETGVNTLRFYSALLDHTTVGSYTWDNPLRIPIVAVCSDRDGEFQRRPTQTQMDRLTAILGSEPRWWQDSWVPNDFV
jgi:hypothetical protein